MTHAEINKALPCGKMGRYMRRGDGVIRTQLWSIRERTGDQLLVKGAGTGLTSNGRAMVRKALEGSEEVTLIELTAKALKAHEEHLEVRRIKERRRA